jgi:subtilisin family serine protease
LKKQFIVIVIVLTLPIAQFFVLGINDYELPQIIDSRLKCSNVDNTFHISSSEIKISSTYNAQDHIGLQDSLWDNGLTGKNIAVAVLDTGIFANHSAFTNGGKLDWFERIVSFYDVIANQSSVPRDDHGHGTWATSILGGNCSDYQGVAPDINLVILKIFDSNGETNASILENAISWVVQNKDVYDIYGDGTINAPASDKAVLAVGGVDYDGNMYSSSAKGPTFEGVIKPDVCAPAVGVIGADKGFQDDYSYRTGTSGATPFVAGLAALMLEKEATLTPIQLKSIISLTSFKTVNPRVIQDNVQGWGIIQGYAALDALNNPILINESTEIGFSLNQNVSVYCLPIKLKPNHYFFELNQLGSARAEMYLFNMDPNEYGSPILISHTINQLFPDNLDKKMGVFASEVQDYYLVVKLVQSASGSFLIRLVFEYRNITFIILLGINVIGLIYIRKLSLSFKKRDRID